MAILDFRFWIFDSAKRDRRSHRITGGEEQIKRQKSKIKGQK
jgi:hypothetical protein